MSAQLFATVCLFFATFAGFAAIGQVLCTRIKVE